MPHVNLTVLTRSQGALREAFNALSSLGFPILWDPQNGNASDRVSAGIRLGVGTSIELVHSPASHVVWPDRPQQQQKLKMCAVNLIDKDAAAHKPHDLSSAALDRLHELGCVHRRSSSSFLSRLPMGWAARQPTSDAAVFAWVTDEDKPSSVSRTVDGGAVDELGIYAKEVVIGAQPVAFSASMEALSAAGAVPTSSAPSVYSLPGGRGAALRLLPSRYSCLVLRSPGPLEIVQQALMSHSGEMSESVLLRVMAMAASSREPISQEPPRSGFDFSPPAPAGPLAPIGSPLGWTASIYGARLGDPRSAQLLLRGGPLEGLDLRFCASPQHAPFFNEPPEEYRDDVDQALNPEAGDPRAAQALSCQSVTGLEVVSQLKARLGFLRAV